MKPDIACREDIVLLVNRFYQRVKGDQEIGQFFSHVNWDKHLAVMYDFWENALFYTGGYLGNPLKTHQSFHRKSPLTTAHFQRWLQLFVETVDELFSGNNSEQIKQRALSISTVMQIKIFS